MLKAIETRYKGYLFRSRTEARWAVFFDMLNLNWEYENEGYELGDVRYLPDFFIKDTGSFIEIKGSLPVPSEMRKLTRLAEESNKMCFLVVGNPYTRNIDCYHTVFTSGNGYQNDRYTLWEYGITRYFDDSLFNDVKSYKFHK